MKTITVTDKNIPCLYRYEWCEFENYPQLSGKGGQHREEDIRVRIMS